MARLQFCDYYNMVAILEKGEFNTDFHPMVDFIAASPLRYALTVKPTIFVSHIRQFWSTARIETTDEGIHILATVDGIQRTVSESSLKRNLKLRDEDGIGEGSGTPSEPHHTPFPEVETSHPTTSSIPLPSIPTAPIPPVTQPVTTPIIQYSRRARISQSFALLTVADEPASLVRDVSEEEACPTESGFIADQDRATIVNLQRQYSELQAKFQAQEEEIVKLKDRVKVLEDREGVAAKQSRDDAPIKGRSINEGEAAAERISNDSEEIARVLTSIDAATVLARGIDVPTGSGFIPTAGPPVTVISTGSEVSPTASPIVIKRKGKEVMVESDTSKQEKDDIGMNEQIARDAEVARIHTEEELQGMIDSLDQSNETIAKYLQEYQDFASELPLEKRIELISDLSSALLTVADEPASPMRDVSEGEACPTDSGFIADQDRATITKSSTLPHNSAPRAQEEEIVKLKERAKVLEDKEDVAATQSGDDAPINGRSINEGEAAAERISNNSEEVARVLTSMDAATVLAEGIDVPTGSGFIPTAGPPATVISTGSKVGPTACPIVTRRKGKEVMVESDTPKKKKLQEQIDA
nr:hypothetical protein [Tanacetum cinerariifolium]